MRTQPEVDHGAAAADPLVAVVADDLIWASRLRAAVERAGGVALLSGGLPAGVASDEGVARPAGALVDLGLRRTDAVAIVAALTASGVPVLAVAQHDDVALRKRALAAGASRVYSYNKLFANGPEVIARWLGDLGPTAGRQ
jgi:DNA-binding response OmpR family regulator